MTPVNKLTGKIMRCQKGFTLIEVLVAGAIGIVFVGVSWEILQLSYHTMQVSHIVADEQDLRVAIAESLGGASGIYCQENLYNTNRPSGSDPAWNTNLAAITKLQREDAILVETGKTFKQALDIKTMKLDGTGVVRKFILTYRGKGENKDRSLSCDLEYQDGSKCNLVSCSTSDKSGIWNQACYKVDQFDSSLSGGKVLIGCGAGGKEPYEITGNRTTVLGYEAGSGKGEDEMVAIGYRAGHNSLGKSVAIGKSAGYESGEYSTYVGYNAGYFDYKKFSVGVGAYSGRVNEGFYNTFIGAWAGTFNKIGEKNTIIGYGNRSLLTSGGSYPSNFLLNSETLVTGFLTGSNNTFVGFQVGIYTTTGANNTFIGSLAGTANNTGEKNVFVGSGAGSMNETGQSNVYIGYNAGLRNTDKSGNIFIGSSAGHDNIKSNNIFIGTSAGVLNSTGEYNTIVGNFAGKNTGSNNSFFGHNAGIDNTASHNSFFGYKAGVANTTGTFNTFIGSGAGRVNTIAQNNTFIGYNAGSKNEVASSNTFIGHQAGRDNTASSNTFIGEKAGERHTTGVSNIYIGRGAGKGYGKGGNNIFIGNSSGAGDFTNFADYIGNHNTFVGHLSGEKNKTGEYNSFFGSDVGSNNETGRMNTFIGGNAGQANTTGEYNTFIGYAGGQSNITGNHNTLIGFGADTTTSNNIIIKAGGSSATRIIKKATRGTPDWGMTTSYLKNLFKRKKNEVTPNGGNIIIGSFDLEKQKELTANNNYLWIGDLIEGNTKEKWVHIKNSLETKTLYASLHSLSDRRLKKDIQHLSNNHMLFLEKISQLQPVSFYWKDEARGSEKQLGFIAQEVEKVIPEVVKEDRQGFLTINYPELIPALTEAIKELSKRVQKIFTNVGKELKIINKLIAEHFSLIQNQEKEIQELKTKLQKNEQRLEQIEKELDKIKHHTRFTLLQE